MAGPKKPSPPKSPKVPKSPVPKIGKVAAPKPPRVPKAPSMARVPKMGLGLAEGGQSDPGAQIPPMAAMSLKRRSK